MTRGRVCIFCGAVAMLTALVLAFRRLCDWHGLDDPGAWTVPDAPGSRQGPPGRARIDATGAGGVRYGYGAGRARGAL